MNIENKKVNIYTKKGKFSWRSIIALLVSGISLLCMLGLALIIIMGSVSQITESLSTSGIMDTFEPIIILIIGYLGLVVPTFLVYFIGGILIFIRSTLFDPAKKAPKRISLTSIYMICMSALTSLYVIPLILFCILLFFIAKCHSISNRN